jgi:hypothetical protein
VPFLIGIAAIADAMLYSAEILGNSVASRSIRGISRVAIFFHDRLNLRSGSDIVKFNRDLRVA